MSDRVSGPPPEDSKAARLLANWRNLPLSEFAGRLWFRGFLAGLTVGILVGAAAAAIAIRANL